MSTALKIAEPAGYDALEDRPGWIPAEITYDWDTNPYAYQTEEELMPAGGLHGQILAYLMEILRDSLGKKELMLLMDTFMMYRDMRGIKQRVAPDLLLMPYRDFPPSSYDLDIEPSPLGVIEVTSPKSHLKDLKDNVPFYMGLGIPTYLAVDAITPKPRLREQIRLCMWRNRRGQGVRVQPDSEGYLLFPEMDIKVKAVGQRLIFSDNITGELLLDSVQLNLFLEEERQKTEQERQRADEERQRAELLAEKLRSIGIDPDEIVQIAGKQKG
ncbi:MAG: hypothetical protein GY795_47715 [Desulfobacterales bacterium]|nr:hypothetical protein [Desulfobacterales bacterium]